MALSSGKDRCVKIFIVTLFMINHIGLYSELYIGYILDNGLYTLHIIRIDSIL